MSEQPPEPRPLPVSGSPRSPVWRWYLGTSTAAAYTLITGLVMGMVQSAFSDSTVGKSVVATLRGVFWAILAIAALYVGLRLVSGARERSRRARELAVTADLIAPGVKVVGNGWQPPELASEKEVKDLSDCKRLAWALDALPITEPPMGFSIDAIVALYTALVDAESRIPAGGHGSRESAVSVINTLVYLGYLELAGPGRFRRVSEKINDPQAEHRPEEHVLATVLPAFLQHHADLATRWATALNTTDLAKGAARWFQDEQDLLRNVVLQAPGEDKPDDDQLAKQWRRRSVMVELSRIVDALDVWYTIDGRPELLKDPAERLLKLTKGKEGDPSKFPALYALAQIRAAAGELKEPPPGFRPRGLEATVGARREHQDALRKLVELPKDIAERSELDGVEKQVEWVWWKLARRDVAGEVCALINLAIVHLRQGRLEAAQDRLELAEYLTRTGRDPSGRAHALELRGTVCWAGGTPRRAVEHWLRSLDLYHTLGEVHGEARCQQHLGSALVMMPTLGGLVLDTADGQLNERMVLRAATELLESSRSKRVGDGEEDRTLAGVYLDRARKILEDLPDNAAADEHAVVASPKPTEPGVSFGRKLIHLVLGR